MSEIATLADLLARRAQDQPDDRAYVFLSDRGRETGSVTFAELDRRVSTLARHLAAQMPPGERALLLFLPSLDFIVAFFACLATGIIPVPMMVPRRTASRDESASIVADCTPRIALTNRELFESPRGAVLRRDSLATIKLLVVDDLMQPPVEPAKVLAPPKRSDVAFLQYTSGSTSAPKGVMVTHANLIANLEMMRNALVLTRRSTFVTWLPLYHDMGLILAVLNALYAGSMCVLMAPVAFVQRPMTWLKAIQSYRAEVAGAPNFGFDLCVDRLNPEQAQGLDLSSWRIAFNASEPVRHETIERFAAAFKPYGFDPNAMYPCYGMAEATLLISAGRRSAGPVQYAVSRSALQQGRVEQPGKTDDTFVAVGCGVQFPGEQVAIVDPDRCTRLAANCIGEIWASGPNICRGYWQNAEATASAFHATIESEGDRRWLRTGDLGFLDERGELYISGRIKDVIIIRGINHYPQDIESTVQDAHPALRRNGGAAFAVQDERGVEAIAIVQEVERTSRNQVEADEIAAVIREAVFQQHELAVKHVALVRPGSVPKTTSGKIQRSLARRLWQSGELEVLQPATVSQND